MAAALEFRLYSLELENLLVLRAAAAGSGDRAEAQRMEARVLDASRRVGYQPPEEFNGRRDLLRLWHAGRGASQ